MRLNLITACAALTLGACAMQPMTSPKTIDNASLPESVRVPAGEAQKLWTTTTGGKITYECREKKDAAGQHEWVFVGPVAGLQDADGKAVGKYYGPPATWDFNDGSKVSGAQLAVAPNGSGNIPLQLVRANPAMGSGMAQGVSHIQRVATKGGVAPAAPCDASTMGSKRVVTYTADYIFWKPA